MTISDDEDVSLAEFLESEVLSEVSDDQEEEKEETGENVEEEEEEKEPKIKRARFGEKGKEKAKVNEKEYYNFNCNIISSSSSSSNNNNNHSKMARGAENGSFSKIPPEIFSHILKFLSSEDLIACSLVCRYLNYAASDESLWRRLYCMRWGLLPPSKKLSECAWKKLYIQRDEEDMVKIVRNCPPEFKEYYIQMQAAKRSQAPLPSQLKDDRTNLDKSVADQVSIWKSSRGLSDNVVTDHVCSGETCSYYQIGDAFICEKTGNVHVCDDTCREVIMDPANELLVCTISGRCFDRLLLPSETETDHDQQQGGVTDEAEPFMGSGRFARAYLLGYNCDDEKELEAALRFC